MKVYRHKDAKELVKMVSDKKFNWYAFFFGFWYFAFKGMIGMGFLMALLKTVVIIGSFSIGDPLAILVAAIGAQAFMGFKANSLQEQRLLNQGFIPVKGK